MFSRTTPVRPGVDRCVVGLKLLAVGDKVYLVEGQRVGVKGMMEDQLFAYPWQYIAVLKPRGGLFGGEMGPGKYSGVVKIPSTAEPQSCPACNALNHPSAAKCSRCGSLLTPAAVSGATREGAGSK